MDHQTSPEHWMRERPKAGRPILVMELVRGIKITHYCDQNNLSAEDRLGSSSKSATRFQHAIRKELSIATSSLRTF